MANYIYNGQLLTRDAISEANSGNLDIFQFGNLIFNDNVLFNSPYWRSSSAGATYLENQPYLHIREGLVVGSGIKYNDLGLFGLKSISIDGYDRNTMTFQAQNRVATLESRNKILPSEFRKRLYYYSDFNNPGDIKDFDLVAPGLWGISNSILFSGITSGYSGFISPTPRYFVATLNNSNGLEDYIITLKIKYDSSLTGDDCGAGIFHRIHDTYSADEWLPQLSTLSYIAPANWVSGTSYASINGVTVGIPMGTWVYLTSIVRGNRFVNYYGLDPETMTYTNSGNLFNPATPWMTTSVKNGAVGFGHWEDEASHSMKYDSFEVREIASEYTKGDILRKIVSSEDLCIVPPIKNIGLSDFVGLSTNGFTYGLGTTNGAVQLNMGSSLVDEFKGRYQTNGLSLNDFSVSFDFKWSGVSGVGDIGIGFGNTLNYMGILVGRTAASEFYGYDEEIVATKTSGTLLSYLNDIWYSGRVTKKDTLLSFFMNNTLVKQAGGVSLSILNSPGDFFISTGGLGKMNFRLSIRNLKFDEFIDVPQTYQTNSGEAIQGDLQRLFPYGYNLNILGASLELNQLGSSFASFNSGDIIRASHTNNLNRYMKFLYAKGDNVAVTYVNPSDKIVLNGLISDNAKTLDNSVDSKEFLEEYGKYDLRREMSDSDIYNIVTLHRPNWNVFDNVACQDYTLGMSGYYYVDTLLKRYGAEGEYLQYTTVKRNVI
jgi:hypothetical protein